MSTSTDRRSCQLSFVEPYLIRVAITKHAIVEAQIQFKFPGKLRILKYIEVALQWCRLAKI